MYASPNAYLLMLFLMIGKILREIPAKKVHAATLKQEVKELKLAIKLVVLFVFSKGQTRGYSHLHSVQY